MKKFVSLLIIILAILSLSIPAKANTLISDPNLDKQYEDKWDEYERLQTELANLTKQFIIDNLGVREYNLKKTKISPNLWYSTIENGLGLNTLYTNYNGKGFYKAGETVTVKVDEKTYKAVKLLPDPRPELSAQYAAEYKRITALMKKAEDTASEAAMTSINEDWIMLNPITSRYQDDEHILLAFQIGNYMYCSGAANKKFIATQIVSGSRNVTPYTKNGCTMLPIRCIVEGLGGTIDWDKTQNAAVANLNDIKIIMPIGSKYAYVNDQPIELLTPAEVIGGRTMVPIKPIAEAFGYETEWVSDGRYVLIREDTRSWVSNYNFKVPNGFDQGYYSSGDWYSWTKYIPDYPEDSEMYKMFMYYFTPTNHYTHADNVAIAYVEGAVQNFDTISEDIKNAVSVTTDYITNPGITIYEGWIDNTRYGIIQYLNSKCVYLLKSEYPENAVDHSSEVITCGSKEHDEHLNYIQNKNQDMFFGMVYSTVTPILSSHYN